MASSHDEDGRVRRGEESRKARREHIKRMALSVFAERGVHQTSVSDLVAAAGIARGTFYLYFDNKDALFFELLDDLMGHVRASVVGVDMAPGAPPLDVQLQQALERILATVVTNRPLTRILFREAIGLSEEVDRRLRAFDDELRIFVRDSLERGARLGANRTVDVEVSAACVVGSVREVINRSVVMSDDEFDPSGVARALIDHHLHGLLP